MTVSFDLVVDGLIVVPSVLGLLWSVKECFYLGQIKMDGHKGSLQQQDSLDQKDSQKILEMMNHVQSLIQEGQNQFLFKEYQYMQVYIVQFSQLLYYVTGFQSTVQFIVGSLTSILQGYIGMKIQVYTNVRTTHESWKSLERGYDVSIRGGCVMGLSLVQFGVLQLWILIKVYNGGMFQDWGFKSSEDLYDQLQGFGLGGSSIQLFGRVGGGIYTKQQDVGQDLSGKNEYGMDEDDPRNPQCIQDNVGDNVGDIQGMGQDLFGSFQEQTCAQMVVQQSSEKMMRGHGEDQVQSGISADYKQMMLPVLVSSTGILQGMLTLQVVNYIYPVKQIPDIEKQLKGILVISTVVETPLIWFLQKWCLPESFDLQDNQQNLTYVSVQTPQLVGQWSGLIIGFITEYYTSHSYVPVREISNTQKVSQQTGIIYGLQLGYLSCIIPVICLGVTVLVSHQMSGSYGVQMGALGMLSTMTMGLTIDQYGPISDNQGGIQEMSGLGEEVRQRTDQLDQQGNTTQQIGKGFQIGSQQLVSLQLFGQFCVRQGISTVNILDPWCFSGLLYGQMMPYQFQQMTMKSVGEQQNDMVKECMEQFPKIMNGEMKPQYKKCIEISTEQSLREMIQPGLLVILSPLLQGMQFGKNCTQGLLSGQLVSGVQLQISMSNSGGQWDNAKKYIEQGGLGSGYGKGSGAHKNQVTGDTVGDPLKDTSGPQLNIVVKLSQIMSLVFGTMIKNWSNEQGGPFWIQQ